MATIINNPLTAPEKSDKSISLIVGIIILIIAILLFLAFIVPAMSNLTISSPQTRAPAQKQSVIGTNLNQITN